MTLQYLQTPSLTQTPQGLVIFLHGWGANARDLYPLAEELNLPQYYFLFPDAPFPHPRVPGGLMWYDLEFPDHQQLESSHETLKAWLISMGSQFNVPLEKIVLAGFSQGGAMTLNVGFSLPLAGLICLSGYLHAETQIIHKLPLLLMHGRFDRSVPLEKGQQACQQLQEEGIDITYAEFDMAHQVIPEELDRVQQFLVQCLQ
ncbi:alpha/beta hydrolase [Roseofilum casamattae]|uniref:alpha/beta hydrolase n=1 Tax=Roseofilum casamattae TaxID=3082944 RepID=UPI0024BE8C53|nr:hypothetical protein [Roseofilum casamattae]